MVDRPLCIDADGHVVEQRDTWIDYIDPALRDRAIRITVDERGDEVLTEMLASGVFERHPRPRRTVLESGATWIAAWLDRMDHKFEVICSITPSRMKPSEHFFRRCLVSADPDETVNAPIIEAVGADYFAWASDYPHIDASFGVVGEISSGLTTLREEDQAKVLGLNANRFYGLEVPSLV